MCFGRAGAERAARRAVGDFPPRVPGVPRQCEAFRAPNCYGFGAQRAGFGAFGRALLGVWDSTRGGGVLGTGEAFFISYSHLLKAF